jgi:hypothetical protein
MAAAETYFLLPDLLISAARFLAHALTWLCGKPVPAYGAYNERRRQKINTAGRRYGRTDKRAVLRIMA